MDNQLKKQRFPFGMLVVLLLFLLGVSSLVAAGYFYFTSRERLAGIVESTKSYAVPLAESLAGLAALSYRLNDYSALKALVHTKIEENIIDEAFFVLENGAIVAHSRKEVEKELQGNIAHDEFAYNIDLILGPLREKSKDTRIIDYNIIDRNIPFRKIERELLKKYFYDGIDTTGWLVTKAVYAVGRGKEQPLGTVNFLIGKERIYREIYSIFGHSILLIEILSVVSFLMAVIVSIFVYIRYRKMQRASIKREEPSRRFDEESIAVQLDECVLSPITAMDKQDTGIADEFRIDVTKPVRDAIPVRKRTMRS